MLRMVSFSIETFIEESLAIVYESLRKVLHHLILIYVIILGADM